MSDEPPIDPDEHGLGDDDEQAELDYYLDQPHAFRKYQATEVLHAGSLRTRHRGGWRDAS